jgi:hypothetical protein
MLYAGCHDNFNDGTPGEAAIKVLAHNGVQLRVEYPDCCGMPKFENYPPELQGKVTGFSTSKSASFSRAAMASAPLI